MSIKISQMECWFKNLVQKIATRNHMEKGRMEEIPKEISEISVISETKEEVGHNKEK